MGYLKFRSGTVAPVIPAEAGTHILTALITLVFICTFPCISSAESYIESSVVKVIDGDTIRIANGSLVRYIGINTPEVRKRDGKNWIYAPEPYAIEAKEYNIGLVSGKKVRLEFDEEKEDRYGRLLAYVYTENGVMVNTELIKNGLAVVYFFDPNIKYMHKFFDTQAEARRDSIGIWKGIKTISPAEAHLYTGELIVVKGRIQSTSESENNIFLNFNVNKGYTFSAMIPKYNLPLFEKVGIFPKKDLPGRDVEVTGKIRFADSPNILINNPSNIKIIKSNP